MSVTAKCLINSQYAIGSVATLVYLVPLNTHTIIDKFTATNIDSGSNTVTINIVPQGQNTANSNLVIDALSVAASATTDISTLQNQILNAGDTIYAQASAGSKVVIRASGREVV